MEEKHRQEEDEPQVPDLPFTTKASVFVGTALPVLIADGIAHWGIAGLALGGFTAFALAKTSPQIYNQARRHLPHLSALSSGQTGKRTVWDRLTDRYPDDTEPAQLPHDEWAGDALNEAERRDDPSQDGLLFCQTRIADTAQIRRATIDEICEHITYNSYWIYLGRSLTADGNPAVPICIYKKHIKLIGASQKGKSSMAAALLEIITRTHDPQHVRIALLDLEDQTSNLFANVPHLGRVTVEGRKILLHARSREQVLEYLTYIVKIMDFRYTLTRAEVAKQPILLVYIEEFLAFKNYYKRRVEATKGEEKEQAKRDYAQLIYCINELALRGLKARVQLLLCAQVDYRDEDLQEALTSITSGMSFCVRPSAASAAGFYNTELIKRNAIENAIGQAVVEMPEINDLILAPDYNLEQRLLDLEQQETEQAQRNHRYMQRENPLYAADDDQTPGTPPSIRREEPFVERLDGPGRADVTTSMFNNEQEPILPTNVRTFPNHGTDQPGETSDVTTDERPKTYRLSEREIQQFVSAYRACGNIDKALNTLNRGARYRMHANEIITAYGLRKNA